MPRVHKQMLAPQSMPLPHDPGGKLHQLQVQAMSVVFGAQYLPVADPSDAEYRSAVHKGISCMEQARAGWLAVRTGAAGEVLQNGDLEGAGRCAVALAGFSLELDLCGAALRWLTKARKELGRTGALEVTKNTEFVLLLIDAAFEEKLLRELLQAWRAVCAGAQA